jgi:hypothetical protein
LVREEKITEAKTRREIMGGSLVEKDWGEKITKYESSRLPLVLHFRPQTMVRVKHEKLKDFAALVRKNLGIVFDDDGDGPFGPQPTVSGSGDGWDDFD